MIRQLPIIPTILVVAAAGMMVWLGFWQLGRAEEKAAMIAEFHEAKADWRRSFPIVDGESRVLSIERFVSACDEPRDWHGDRSWQKRKGASGWAHRFVPADYLSPFAIYGGWFTRL